jgi:Fur family peroxide stress response transcriptional regulator
MSQDTPHIRHLLEEKGLKVTPQRISVMEAVHALGNHPTADAVLAYVRRSHPNIASGTVYRVLDVLVDKQLLRRVKTERDAMRYDGILEKHHHLYCAESEKIRDYWDEELDNMLEAYFNRKKIQGFHVEEIKLQINGKFKTPKK